MNPIKVSDNIFLIGGSNLTHPYDCCIYLIKAEKNVLIDSGAGLGLEKLKQNLKKLGIKLNQIDYVIATHCHIDHIGCLKALREEGAKIIAHKLDAKPIETATKETVAHMYGIKYQPTKVDIKISKETQTIQINQEKLKIIHIPGHTPGSIAILLKQNNKKILFGQDIHGPYLKEYGANPKQAKQSLQKLIQLKPDILCEGHYGIIKPQTNAINFIQKYANTLP